MVKREKRFQVLLNESPAGGGLGMATTIFLDTQTGVQYLQVISGYGGGLTPLLDAEGRPVVWDLDQLEDQA